MNNKNGKYGIMIRGLNEKTYEEMKEVILNYLKENRDEDMGVSLDWIGEYGE